MKAGRESERVEKFDLRSVFLHVETEFTIQLEPH